MNMELLLRALFKFMGVNENDMRHVFERGQSLIVDGAKKIDTIDERLSRIEAALNITLEKKEILDVNGHEKTH